MKAAGALLLSAQLTASAVTLDECIQSALADSPALEAAGQRAASARNAMSVARSAYLPQVKIAGQYARTDNPPQAFMMALNQRTLNMADPAFNPNQPNDTENLRLTQVGPGTPGGALLRRYWQPLCAASELTAEEPKKAITMLGEELVIQVGGPAPLVPYGSRRWPRIGELVYRIPARRVEVRRLDHHRVHDEAISSRYLDEFRR